MAGEEGDMVTEEEVVQLISSLPLHKSPGIDGITT